MIRIILVCALVSVGLRRAMGYEAYATMDGFWATAFLCAALALVDCADRRPRE